MIAAAVVRQPYRPTIGHNNSVGDVGCYLVAAEKKLPYQKKIVLLQPISW